MIDLHSHILPGIDDGAPDMETSVAMARMAVADGTQVIACTPHIRPPIYNNVPEDIRDRVAQLAQVLRDQEIDLKLVTGADVHIAPDLAGALARDEVAALGKTRYFLFEPPSSIMPKGLVQICGQIMRAGYKPILTHPERFSWIDHNYDVFCQLHDSGVVVQLTAASVTGRFGRRPQYWSQRMLEEGRAQLIASDAHSIEGRPPGLSEARNVIASNLGDETAMRLVWDNPLMILKDMDLPAPQTNSNQPSAGVGPASVNLDAADATNKPHKRAFWSKLTSKSV